MTTLSVPPVGHPLDTITGLVARQIDATPSAPAVLFGDDCIDYTELDKQSQAVAARLGATGFPSESTVAVVCRRSLSLPSVALGILRAGYAYVPLDPENPPSRLQAIICDAGAVAVVVDDAAEAAVNHACVLSSRELVREPVPMTAYGADVTPSMLAYVMYTSGSTGKPKGVLVEHGAIANRLRSLQGGHPIDANDRVLQKTPVTFDVSIWELFWPLITGATLVIADPGAHRDPHVLAETIRRHRVTTIHFVPSMLELFLEAVAPGSLPSVRRVFVGGEPLMARHVRAFHQRLDCELFNLYGPTEAAVDVTEHPCPTLCPDGPIPIGRALPGVDTLVVDRDLKSVPPGTVGELVLGGVQLARGYLDDPRLTAERFVPGAVGGGRLYRTGDLARERPDGVIEFIGRSDEQLKVHGVRTEPGEIESALVEHPSVARACVTAIDGPAGKRLVAYVVAHESRRVHAADARTAWSEALTAHLSARLPSALVPRLFVELDELPLTASGKVDRRALSVPAAAALSPSSSSSSSSPSITSLEHAFRELWSSVLGLDDVGADGNFFELGGDSLMAVSLIGQLRRVLGCDVSYAELAEHPTPADLARAARRVQTAAEARDRPRVGGETFGLSGSQEIAWFGHLLDREHGAYTFTSPLEFVGELDLGALEYALRTIVDRHEIYRTTFSAVDGRPLQRVHPAAPLAFRVIAVPTAATTGVNELLQEVLEEEASRGFDLGRLPLVRWTLVQVAADRHVLVHAEHHLIHDGWSYNIFLAELLDLYQAKVNAVQAPSPPTGQYRDHVAAERAYLESEEFELDLEYWRKALGGAGTVNLATDRPRPAQRRLTGGLIRQFVPPELAEEVVAFSRRNGVTPFATMLAAFAALLFRHSDSHDFVVGTAAANRSSDECSMLGMFVNTLGIRFFFEEDLTALELARVTAERIAGAVAHQRTPVQSVVQALASGRDTRRNPLFDTLFSFHDSPLPRRDIPNLTVKAAPKVGNRSAKFDLDVLVTPRADRTISGERITTSGMLVAWEYNADLFDPSTVEDLAGRYIRILTSLVNTPHARVSRLQYLTDTERLATLTRLRRAPGAPPPVRLESALATVLNDEVRANSVAIAGKSGSRTYAQVANAVHDTTARLSGLLKSSEPVVVVAADSTAELVVGLLSTLAAGAVYLPVDPRQPVARLAAIIEASEPAVLLASQRVADEANGWVGDFPVVHLEVAADASSTSRLPRQMSGGSLAYLMYTSGSTGAPKGVGVSRDALVNHAFAVIHAFGLGRTDRVLQWASPSFDVSLEETLPTLLAGGAVVPIEQLRPPPERFMQFAAAAGVTVANLPSSYFAALADVVRSSPSVDGHRLRLMIIGSEPLRCSPEAWRAFRATYPEIEIVHGYGVTEACVTSLVSRLGTSLAETPPIGRPLSRVHAYVFDEEQDIVPIGVPGELVLGGAGVARGYLGRPAGTASAFVPNPYGSPGERVYRTGDRARLTSSEEFEFLGRSDRQVKIGGFRVELDEIDNALQTHPLVRDAVATVIDSEIVACVVGEGVDAQDVKAYLRGRLPYYMVPQTVFAAAVVPRQRGGKVDYRELAILYAETRQDATMPPGAPVGAATAPRTELAVSRDDVTREILAIWRDVVGREAITLTDDLFESGGNSLDALRIIARIEGIIGVEIGLHEIFEDPSVGALVALASRRLAERTPLPPPHSVSVG